MCPIIGADAPTHDQLVALHLEALAQQSKEATTFIALSSLRVLDRIQLLPDITLVVHHPSGMFQDR